jgi:hypothetical protein
MPSLLLAAGGSLATSFNCHDLKKGGELRPWTSAYPRPIDPASGRLPHFIFLHFLCFNVGRVLLAESNRDVKTIGPDRAVAARQNFFRGIFERFSVRNVLLHVHSFSLVLG